MSRIGTHLYLIRNSVSGAIKIGSTGDVARRLRELELSIGQPLELLVTVEGGGQSEKRLHAMLDEERLVGEWFRCSRRLAWLVVDASRSAYPGHVIDVFLGWSDPGRPRRGEERHNAIVLARQKRGNASRRSARQKRSAARIAELRSDWWRQMITPNEAESSRG